MNAVREWAQSVVVAALIAAIAGVVAPSGNLEKSVKIIIALVMLLAFAAPLVEFRTEIPEAVGGLDEVIEQHELEKQVEKEVMETLSGEIRASLSAYISSLGCEQSKIETDMDIDSGKNISIKSITIYLPQDFARATDVEKHTQETFGVTPRLIFYDEGSLADDEF